MSKKRGQITIFMIVALVILFTVVFLIQITSSIQKGKLASEQERIIGKTFNKEGLRIFVNDCLEDEMTKGLLLAGSQGRIWDDQPGGVMGFAHNQTGVKTILNGKEERIFYGISDDPLFEAQNIYPCDATWVNKSPEFCQYYYPNTSVEFGSLDLKASTIINDVERYVRNKTIECVHSFIEQNISSAAQFESVELELQLKILPDVIAVQAQYPVSFRVGDEEFFQLSTFDFMYPSRLKQLLDAAVEKPLRWDHKYVDFNYTDETLKEPHFTYGTFEGFSGYCGEIKEQGFSYYLCNRSLAASQYKSLAIRMNKTEIANGDTIFEFQPAALTIVKTPEPFVYRFARQNRPPALDYVGRYSCPSQGYDYLVVQGENNEMGAINITPTAHDPDEDIVDFTLDTSQVEEIVYGKALASYTPPSTPSKKQFYSSPATNKIGIHNVTVLAKDEHGKTDWQIVRILIDRPLTTTLDVSLPYTLFDGNTQTYISYDNAKNTYWQFAPVSTEDPTFVSYTIPNNTLGESSQGIVTVSYNSTHENVAFGLPYTLNSQKEGCLDLPASENQVSGPVQNCLLSSYDEQSLQNWKGNIDSFDVSLFQNTTTPGVGSLSLDFSMNYCGNKNISSSAEVDVMVVECIPHRNPEFPWGYHPTNKYHTYKYQYNSKENFTGSFENINPFNATNACCLGAIENPPTWKIADNTTECFVSPELGCYGRIEGYTLSENRIYNADPKPDAFFGYILEEQYATCSGERGNMCGDRAYRLPTSKLSSPNASIAEKNREKRVCGTNSLQGCSSDINQYCANKEAFGYQDLNNDGLNDGWCHGKMGCTNFCQSSITYLGNDVLTTKHDTKLAQQILSNPTTEENLEFMCGCTSEESLGKSCDSNFDGRFEGICTSQGLCCKSSQIANAKDNQPGCPS